MDAPIDPAHARPEGATDEHVAASGKFTEALAYLERARGHLYSFHRLVGEADAMLDEVIENLRSAGSDVLASRVADELRGQNVLAGRWTFQVVEEFDDGYYTTFRDLECLVRDELMAGRRHVYEAEMKQRRRTPHRPGHEAIPGDTAHSPLSRSDDADHDRTTPARRSVEPGPERVTNQRAAARQPGGTSPVRGTQVLGHGRAGRPSHLAPQPGPGG